jgi:hypothetical protein
MTLQRNEMIKPFKNKCGLRTSLIDRSLIISPAIIKRFSEGYRCISTEINSMLSYAIYHCIILDDRLNSLLQNSNIDNLITVQPSLSKCILKRLQNLYTTRKH